MAPSAEVTKFDDGNRAWPYRAGAPSEPECQKYLMPVQEKPQGANSTSCPQHPDEETSQLRSEAGGEAATAPS